MKKRNITELQILAEILRKQPHIKQKEIAENLGITVQAVSEHIRNLVKEGYITAKGRGEYVITEKGIKKLKDWMSEFKKYLEEISAAIYRYKDVWPAIAEEDVKEGDEVYLYMYRGNIYASKNKKTSAKGTVLVGGKKGEDIALHNLSGIIPIDRDVKVYIFKVPPEIFGGSKKVDYDLIKENIKNLDNYVVATMGTVGYVVANKLNLTPEIRFAVGDGIIKAIERGTNVILFVTGKMSEKIIKKLEKHKISYQITDVQR
ncbi:winged helix-turn-helix transcriptional regulator [Methanocaldococcus indicus]|uniref:DUF7839 domain-containing protein n=1 Tax=Methanocaldococcus indicus TaxID=213231 RepID=UPI003C6D2AB9